MKDESLSRSLMLICFGAAGVLASTIRVEPLQLPKLNLSMALPDLNLAALKSFVRSEPTLPTQVIAKSHPSPPPAKIVVDLSDRRVYLYKSQQLQATYPVAVGQAGWETPIGNFKVLKKQRNPVWQQPITGDAIPTGAGNPLGDRWIGFWSDGRHQIGFHGTNNERLVGQAVSHGCLRMRNRDIRTLFNQAQEGMPVIVRK